MGSIESLKAKYIHRGFLLNLALSRSKWVGQFRVRLKLSVECLEENSMLQSTEHCHIVRNSEILSGEPIIRGTRTPVRAIVEMWRIGVSLEEIPQRLPHLVLSQVFDALSYYLDHQVEINEHIERNRIPDELIDPRVRRA